MVPRIDSPTFVVDEARLRANVEKMAKKARASGCRFRPHFKTHQSAKIGEIFREMGTTSITVSSIGMAEYFAANGWDDITVAVPVNVREMSKVDSLAKKIHLGILVDNIDVVKTLMGRLHHPLDVWIEIDTGSPRTGLLPTETAKLRAIIQEIRENHLLEPEGLLTHAGHAYSARSREEIMKVYTSQLSQMADLREFLREEDFELEISVGDTPTCSIVDQFDPCIAEVRPGNFVFYDLSQVQIGSCREADIAVAVACPVISQHLERDELIIYGGAIHHSKQFLEGSNGIPLYGKICLPLPDGGWGPSIPGASLFSLSQEHGRIKIPIDKSLWGGTLPEVGDLLYVLPVHSCLTANLFETYATTRGEIIEHYRYGRPARGSN